MEQKTGSNVVPLRAAAPDDLAERPFVEMLEGWRNQQLARNLAFATIGAREAEVRRLVAEAGEYPWRWSPQLVDEWLGDQRAVRHLRQSTIRSKAVTLRLFCVWQGHEGLGTQAKERAERVRLGQRVPRGVDD